MEKLPATSYVRLVDIWLISIQLVPFLLVTMTTASELFMDEKPDESYTNHHGMARLVPYLVRKIATQFKFSLELLKLGLLTVKVRKW